MQTSRHAGKMNPSLVGKQVQSSFVGTILCRQYTNCMNMMPRFVGIRSVADLSAWAKTITATGEVKPFTPKGGGWGAPWNYSTEDAAMRAEVEAAVQQIDWKKAAWDVYAPVPFDEAIDGPAFAPAFNSMWLVREKPGGQLLLWFIHAAIADGTPRNGYFGTAFDKPIVARAGAKFHPLADEQNFYRVSVSDAPLRLTIECFYHKHDPQMTSPYLTVDSIFEVASREEVEKVTGAIGVDDVNDEERRQAASLIVKGSMVESILQLYLPNASKAQLFALLDDSAVDDKYKQRVEGGMSRSDALKKVPLSLDKRIIGPLLDLFCDFASWRSALWLIDPKVEALAEAENVPQKQPQHEAPRDQARDGLRKRLAACPAAQAGATRRPPGHP